VRKVYEIFLRRKKGNVPFVDRTLFCKIMPFSRINSMYIFQNFSKTICKVTAIPFFF